MLNGNSAFPGAKDPRGQLTTIFAVFGCPTEETWPGISNYPYYEPERFMFYERRDLKTVFRELSEDADAEDLALKCLSLRPEFRISARDSMKHPYFRSLPPQVFRLPESEYLNGPTINLILENKLQLIDTSLFRPDLSIFSIPGLELQPESGSKRSSIIKD